jgi:hypothetical protein
MNMSIRRKLLAGKRKGVSEESRLEIVCIIQVKREEL